MSTVIVRVGFVRTAAHQNLAAPVFTPISNSESLDSATPAVASGASVVTQAHVDAAGDLNRLVFEIANCGTDNVRYSYGTGTPDATSATASGLPAGGTAYVGVRALGEKVAVANA